MLTDSGPELGACAPHPVLVLASIFRATSTQSHLRVYLVTSSSTTGRSLGQLAPAQAETRPPEPIDLADYRIRRRPIRLRSSAVGACRL
jgi:hypothetical protein